MTQRREALVEQLRAMARRGEQVSSMFAALRTQLGPDIVAMVEHMRAAFHLTLAEAKPLAALSRTEDRTFVDGELVEQLLAPAIAQHRGEWDSQQGATARVP
jgi:hypothetical protein